MSVENVKKFYEAVSQDDSLKQKFVELSQKYQGQQMDEAKAMAAMEQEGLPLAAQLGYSFTVDDLKAYEVEMQKAKMNLELSDEEMQAVAGGNNSFCCAWVGTPSGVATGFCLIIGIGSTSGGAASCCVLLGINIDNFDK